MEKPSAPEMFMNAAKLCLTKKVLSFLKSCDFSLPNNHAVSQTEWS